MPFFRRLLPQVVVTPPGLVHWVETRPERAAMRAWVVEADGRVVGFADARMRWAIAAEGIAALWVGLLPEYRGAGLGTRLYELAASHLADQGARRLESAVREDDAAALTFAARLGFEEGRREQFWALEVPSDVPEPQAHADAAVVRLRDVRQHERQLFELYNAAERDMPDDYVHEMVFEEWLPDTLGNPELDVDLSAVVLHGEQPVSFAWLVTDREGQRAANEMTGTAPEFRRRGLARLAKEATIRWAAEAGIRTIFTSNDTTNADMLALNEHLGYRPLATGTTYAKDL
jgi:GNAT superfamily N-acetyltransferase